MARIADNGAPEQVTLAVLGDVAVFDAAGAERSVSPQRVHILAVLAAAAGSVVPRSSLLDALWGEDTPAARHRLKAQIAQIRSSLGAELSVQFHLDGYRLCGSLERLDSTLFESLVTSARHLSTDEAAIQYERALQLWRGPAAFLGVDSPLIDEARWRLENLHATTLLRLADCEIELLHPARAVADRLEKMFVEDPARGDVTVRLATLRALGDRQLDALTIIRRHRDAVVRRGESPTADVAVLERRILAHDVVASAFAVPGLSRHREIDFHTADGLIGRDAIEGQITQALAHGPVIVCGEAGVGKTVMTLAVGTRLAETGTSVIRVSARPDPTRPMEVTADIIKVLGQLAPQLLHDALETPAAAATVSRLLGEPATSPIAITRERMLAELVDVFVGVLTSTHAALIVEDAHWLDNSSAEILGRLIELGVPRLLVTTRRPLAAAFGEAWNGGSNIEVPSFSVAEVLELLDIALPARATDELAVDLHQGTGGNGLFLRLKLDLLVDGQLGRDLPPTLVHAVHERTAGLSDATREVLRTAALLGQTFSLSPLIAVHPRALEELRDAVEERLVRIDVAAMTGEFIHGLVVDALIEGMPSAARIDRHDRLCRALVALGGSPIAVAKQAAGAEELDAVRVVLTCLAAAQQEAQVFEWASAIEWSRLGLGASTRCGLDDPTIEIELRTLIGKGLRRLNLSGSDRELGRASDVAYELGDHDLFVRCVTELCLHGPTTQAGTVDASARLHLERALAAPVGALQRAELLSAAATLLALSDESTFGRSLYRQALDLAEQADDPAVLRTVRMNAHLGLSHPDDIEQRRRAAQGLLALDDHEAQWEGSFLTFGLALIDADRPSLEASISAARTLTSIVKQRNQLRALHQMESAFAFICGDLDEAVRLADTTFQMCLGSYPMSWAMSIYAALLIPIREAQGRAAELLPQVSALIETSPDFITWHAVTACVAYAADDHEVMAREVGHLAANEFRFVEDLTWTAIATTVCRPIWALRDRASAAVLYERLLPYSGLMTWNGLSTHGPVDSGLACLAAVLGDSVARVRHTEESTQLVGRLGAPHLLWRELAGLSQ